MESTQGNQYHDIKGHFTDKENDGGACYHNLQTDEERIGYFQSRGIKPNMHGVYKEKISSLEGTPYKIVLEYREPNASLEKGQSNYLVYDKDGEVEREFDTYDKAMDYLKDKFDINKEMQKYDWLKDENPKMYQDLKSQMEAGVRDGTYEEGHSYQLEYEPKNDFLKKIKNKLYYKVYDGKFQELGVHSLHLSDFKELFRNDEDDYVYSSAEDSNIYASGKNEEELASEIKEDVKKKLDKIRTDPNQYYRKRYEEKQKQVAYQKKIKDILIPKEYLKDDYNPYEHLSTDSITEGTRVGGYSGHSKSNSAIASEEQGSMPMSKWNKENILDYLSSVDELKPFMGALEKTPIKRLKEITLEYDGWHHTGAFYNETTFYSLRSPADIVSSIINDRKAFERGLKKGFEED